MDVFSCASALWDTSAWKLLPGPHDGKWDGDHIGVESAALAAHGSCNAWCSATPDEKYEPSEIRLGLSDPLTGATLEIVRCECRSFIPSRLVLDTEGDRIFTREIVHYRAGGSTPQRLAV